MKKIIGVNYPESPNDEFETVAGTAKVPAKEVEEHPSLSVSWEEGLDFKSEVGAGNYKKTKSTIPLIIQKTAANASLTPVGVYATGARSGG